MQEEVGRIDKDKLEKLIRKPRAADGYNFSERIWRDKNKLLNLAHQEITKSAMLGSSHDKAIKAIAQAMGTSEFNARRLVMTETSHIHNTAEIEAYKAGGYEQYEFMASFGERTCEVCGGLDGQHFKLTDIQYGVNFPPVHPNCRCTTVCWDEADDEQKALEGQKALDYEEWYQKYVEGREQPKLESKDGAAVDVPSGKPVPVSPTGEKKNAVQTLTAGGDSGIIKDEIRKGNIKLEINPDKQARHIKGRPEYSEGKSYLTISEKEAQDIIDAKSGTGKLLKDKNGKPVKERIDCDKNIGVDVDMDTGEETPTDKATVHYSKTGTHLVPRKENKNND